MLLLTIFDHKFFTFMQNIFLQLYPFQSSKKTALIICVTAGIIIFSIFYFFKPFGLQKNSDASPFLIGLMYGLVTFTVSLLVSLSLPLLLPKIFVEKKWLVYKEIIFLLFIVCCIAVANYVATVMLYKSSNSIYGLYNMLQYTFSFAIFPILFSVVFKQQLLLKKYKLEANTFNESRVKITKLQTAVIDQTAIFIGDNATEKLEILAIDFICAEAEENYTTIYYLQDNNLKKVLYRVSLKKLEIQNQKMSNYFRCHKSFYVNLNKVIELSGNAQGYKLHCEHMPFLISVSRTLNATIKQKILL